MDLNKSIFLTWAGALAKKNTKVKRGPTNLFAEVDGWTRFWFVIAVATAVDEVNASWLRNWYHAVLRVLRSVDHGITVRRGRLVATAHATRATCAPTFDGHFTLGGRVERRVHAATSQHSAAVHVERAVHVLAVLAAIELVVALVRNRLDGAAHARAAFMRRGFGGCCHHSVG